MTIGKTAKEWMRQADYDLDTARAMYDAGRYFYSIFMCHLCLEKALKGLYTKILSDLPPKTHSLVYLVEKISLKLPESIREFVIRINAESVVTRYPEDIQRHLAAYTKERTEEMIEKSKETLEWLKTK